ncbi:MAG: lysophospholipid acyltransferase family protein [Candidatus Sericytochromatia bacterium]
MIKANHRIFFVKLFDYYISYILKKDFHNLDFNKEISFDKNKSILYISNHFSWWDGFFAYFLNNKIFKKKFHVMMLKKELEKRIVFSKIGAFSIEPKSETVEETLKYVCSLLEDKDNFVLIFPQGRLESNHKNTIKFRKGLEYIIKNTKEPIQFIFSSILIDYLQNRKPTAYIYLQSEIIDKMNNIEDIEKKYNSFYNFSKEIQKNKYK